MTVMVPVREGKYTSVVHPDLVFRNSYGKRTAVEVKPVWDKLTDIDGLSKADKNRISDDYEKLRDNYSDFDSKVLLVPFLGEKDDYKPNIFRKFVKELVHGNSAIEIIMEALSSTTSISEICRSNNVSEPAF